MLNKHYGFRTQILSRFVPVFFGVAILIISLQMLIFGWKWRDLDMSETGSEVTESILRQADSITPWRDVIGYRLMARKIETQYLLNRKHDTNTINALKSSVLRVLQVSPLEPSYWILLGRISQLSFAEEEEIVNHLRMSFLSGRSDFTVMSARFNLSLSIWPALTESDKQIAINDITFGPLSERETVADVFAGVPEQTLKEIKAILDERNDDMAAKIDKLIQDHQ